MVWEEICGQEDTLLVIVIGHLSAHHYTGDVLRPTELPFLKQCPRGVIYQHGSARPHTWVNE